MSVYGRGPSHLPANFRRLIAADRVARPTLTPAERREADQARKKVLYDAAYAAALAAGFTPDAATGRAKAKVPFYFG